MILLVLGALIALAARVDAANATAADDDPRALAIRFADALTAGVSDPARAPTLAALADVSDVDDDDDDDSEVDEHEVDKHEADERDVDDLDELDDDLDEGDDPLVRPAARRRADRGDDGGGLVASVDIERDGKDSGDSIATRELECDGDDSTAASELADDCRDLIAASEADDNDRDLIAALESDDADGRIAVREPAADGDDGDDLLTAHERGDDGDELAAALGSSDGSELLGEPHGDALAMLDAELDPGDVVASNDAVYASGTAGAAEQYEQSLRHHRPSAWGRLDVGVSWRLRQSEPMHAPAHRASELWLVATWRR